MSIPISQLIPPTFYPLGVCTFIDDLICKTYTNIAISTFSPTSQSPYPALFFVIPCIAL